MANFLKLFYLQSVTLNIKALPRLRLILNLAIFLSIFAVTASLITIYYEKRIDKVEKKLLDTQIDIRTRQITLDQIIYQITTTSFSFDALKNKLLSDSYYWWTDATVSRDRDIYYVNFMDFYPNVKQDFLFMGTLIGLAELHDINPKKFEKYEVLDKEIEFNKIVDEVLNDIETLTVDDVFDPDIDGYFEKYKDYLALLFQIHNDIQIFLTDGYDTMKKFDNGARKLIVKQTKEISNLSDVSVKVIFSAFLIQLIIFFIIQYFEIAAARRED